MSSQAATLSADHATWTSFIPALQEVLMRDFPGVDDAEPVELASLYVTGSLAIGEGCPGESDADIAIGVTAQHPRTRHQDVCSRVEAREANLCDALGIPVTGIHVVGVSAPNRAAHRAMELQWQGNQLARSYGHSERPLRIYDAVHREFLDTAHDAKPVGELGSVYTDERESGCER